MSKLQQLHDDLKHIEENFHMLAEPEQAMAEKVRAIASAVVEEVDALDNRLHAVEVKVGLVAADPENIIPESVSHGRAATAGGRTGRSSPSTSSRGATSGSSRPTRRTAAARSTSASSTTPARSRCA
jgi:hypothetical protein